MADWSSFLVAQVGASAALAGLLFVGISINMAKIVAVRSLPNRALEALTLLVAILLIGSLLLVPSQPAKQVGLELVGIGAVVFAIALSTSVRSVESNDPRNRRWHQAETALVGVATGCYPLAGALLVVAGQVGNYALVPAVLLSYVIALIDTWVLLIEINR